MTPWWMVRASEHPSIVQVVPTIAQNVTILSHGTSTMAR